MIEASRIAITAALIAFLIGNTLGLAMGLGWLGYHWRPAHAHLQSLGFVTLMIQGVAYHALPRFRGVPFRRPRAALVQVLFAIAGLSVMVAAWGLLLGPAWFAVGGTVAWVANAAFVVLCLELLLKARR
ncbi:MAG: hypothetical protein WD336_05925 [Trueperaceae bacterium]